MSSVDSPSPPDLPLLRAPSRVARLVGCGPDHAGFRALRAGSGAQAAQKGMSVVEVPLMTGLNFGGGSEFAAVALWSSPPHLLLIAAVTLINSRHILMGAALAPAFKGKPLRQVLPALFFMCDEVWALAMQEMRRKGGVISLRYYAGVAAPLYLTWVVCTAIGAAIGPVLGDVTRFGFDMAFPAVFLVMLAGMWSGLRAALPWIASLIAAGLSVLYLPGAWYVPVGTLTGLGVALLLADRAP
ncbi:AzlC family ABC transporter permease [Paracoccus cavernae]|uniref:AzlC family ABC transporter permease n=1 Tax=Paracoccus cavernae TaxID=1571207 RepID=A0ABT8DB99_9RHOB|nr:AzlC family ABC transporter permease [Paracoccus cavernae]